MNDNPSNTLTRGQRTFENSEICTVKNRSDLIFVNRVSVIFGKGRVDITDIGESTNCKMLDISSSEIHVLKSFMFRTLDDDIEIYYSRYRDDTGMNLDLLKPKSLSPRLFRLKQTYFTGRRVTVENGICGSARVVLHEGGFLIDNMIPDGESELLMVPG